MRRTEWRLSSPQAPGGLRYRDPPEDGREHPDDSFLGVAPGNGVRGGKRVVAHACLTWPTEERLGEDGLVPLGPHLKQMASRAGGSGGGSWEGAARLLARQPTALWLAEPLDVALDAWAEGIALLGCVLSLLAMLGQQHVLVFIGLYALYLSLYLAGQSMLSFQWVSRHDIAGI